MIPPLRDRLQDLSLICNDLVTGLSQKLGLPRIPLIKPGAIEKLARYGWPGNIRELRNVVERALILSEQGDISEEHIIGIKPGSKPNRPSVLLGSKETNGQEPMSHAILDLKKSLIEDALLKCNGNVTKAAKLLGMTRDSLRHQIKKTR